MKIECNSFILTYPINDYVEIDRQKLDELKALYEQQYSVTTGAIYGAISFTIDDEQRFIRTSNLNAAWLSITHYLLTEPFNYKQKFPLFIDESDCQFMNNSDQHHPQVQLTYHHWFSQWMPRAVLRKVLYMAFFDFIEVVLAAHTDTCMDEEGDYFDYPPELKGLKENYQLVKRRVNDWM